MCRISYVSNSVVIGFRGYFVATPLGKLCADYEDKCRADACFVSAITEKATCEEAIKILEQHERGYSTTSYHVMNDYITSSHTDNNFPRGCYLHLELDLWYKTSDIKFNNAESGARNNDASQICKIECKNVKDHHYRLQVQII